MPKQKMMQRALHRAGRAALLAAPLALCALPSVAQGDLQQQIDAVRAEMQRVENHLTGELQRIHLYLAYFDQANRLAVFSTQMSTQEADSRLQQMGNRLFQQSFADAELNQLLGTHRSAFSVLMQLIGQRIDAAQRWPNGGAARDWQAYAHGELDRIQRDYSDRNARRIDALPDLEAAFTVLAWTQGLLSTPAGSDPFAGQEQRLIAAIPNSHAQQVTASATQPPPPLPPPTAPPATASTGTPPTGAAAGRTTMVDACGQMISAATYTKWAQLGMRNGFLGCPVSAEQGAARSPIGTAGRVTQFGGGDGGYIIVHDSGARAGSAYEVHGCIFKLYHQSGGTGGKLGFPISDEHDIPNGRRSDFEAGYVEWVAATRICTAYLTAAAPTASVGTTPSPRPPTGQPSASGGQVAARQIERGIDRPGRDYRNFELAGTDPAQCAAACESEQQCRAYTYVNPGLQGPKARCWLKSSVPPPQPNSCCVSGVIRPEGASQAAPAVASPRALHVQVTDATFESLVLRARQRVVVAFCARWAQQCQTINPQLDAVAGALAGKVTVALLDIEESPRTPPTYAVQGVPTFILFSSGKAIRTRTGNTSNEQLRQWAAQ